MSESFDAVYKKFLARSSALGILLLSPTKIVKKADSQSTKIIFQKEIFRPALISTAIFSFLQAVGAGFQGGFLSSLVGIFLGVGLAMLIYYGLYNLTVFIFRKIQNSNLSIDVGRETAVVGLSLFPCFLYGIPLIGLFGSGTLFLGIAHSIFLAVLALKSLNGATSELNLLAGRVTASYSGFIILWLVMSLSKGGATPVQNSNNPNDALAQQMQMMNNMERITAMSNAEKMVHDTNMNILNNIGSRSDRDR